MSTIAELLVKISAEDSGLDKGLKDSQSKLKGWGESLRGVGTKLTAGVTLPLAAAGTAAINWASDQEEAANKVDVVFGESAKAVKKWADSTSGSILLSTGDALEAAGTFGNLFTSMGMGQDESAKLSTSLVELGQDLSSFNNVPTDQALVALRSAIVGEFEPMRALGVQLSQATVEQKALEMGIWDGTGALSAQARVLATNALIMEQTTNAQGDAARTAKGFANRLRKLKADLEDVGAEFGKVLLPYIEDFLGFLLDLLDRFDNLDPKWQKIIVAVAAFAAALGPVLIVIGMMLPAIAALGTALGILLSPIGLVAAALAALIGLGIYAFVNDLWGVRDAVLDIVASFSSFTEGLHALSEYIKAVIDDGDTLNDWLTHLPESIRPVVQGLGEFVVLLQTFIDAMGPVAGDIGDIVQAIGEGDWYEVLDEAASVIYRFSDAIASLSVDALTLIADGLDGLADDVGPFADTIKKVADSIDHTIDAIRKFQTAIDRAFAGDYYGAIDELIRMFGELSLASLDTNRALMNIPIAIARIAPDKLRILADNMRRAADEGSDIENTLRVQAEQADATAEGLERFVAAWDKFKRGNYSDALLDLGNGLANIAYSSLLFVTTVPALLTDIGNAIIEWAANTDFVQSLKQKGTDLIQGLLTGIELGWTFFQKWAAGLPGEITKWVSDAVEGVSWTSLTGKIGRKLKDAIDQITTAAADFPSLAVSIGEGIANAIKDQIESWSGATVKNALTSKLDGLTAAAGDFATWAISIGEGIANAIKGQIESWSGATVKNALTSKLDGLIAAPGDFATWAASIGAAILEDLKAWVQKNITWDVIGGWLKDGASGIGFGRTHRDFSKDAARAQQAAFGKNDSSALSGVFDQVKSIAQQMTNTIAQLATAVQVNLQRVTQSFRTTGQQSASSLQQLLERVQEAFQKIAQTASQQAQQTQQRSTQEFRQMRAQAESQLAQMRSQVQSAMAAMTSVAGSQMAQFSSRVSAGFQQAVSAARSGVGRIRGIVSGLSLYGQGYSIGASLGQGIAAGIRSYIGVVASTAAALVSNAVAAARAAANANSPSRAMMDLGADMAAGMTIGLERGAAAVADATAALVDIPSGVMGASGTTGGNTYISIALKSQELTELIRNAEAGGEFARGFGQQVGLYGGTP